MRPLSTYELLQVWETGIDRPLIENTLRLLAVACSFNNIDEAGHLSIGERDARLLQLREWMFGTRLLNFAKCPKCADQIEWESDLKDLYQQSFTSPFTVRTFVLEKDNFIVHFRLPDSFDISKAVDENNDFKQVLGGCVLEVANNGNNCTLESLTNTVWEALDQRMQEEDPQAAIRMDICCPSCSHRWQAIFDITSFLWAEINNWAKRITREVYMLARGFGWSEKDILGMSARRRQMYLEILNA